MYTTLLLPFLLAGCGDTKDTTPSETDTDPGADTTASFKDCSSTPGLESVSTDPNITAVADAVLAFLLTLPQAQLEAVQYCLDDEELYSWTNIDVGDMPRTGGLEFQDLSEESLAAAYAAFDAFLSTQGYDDMYTIININEPATAEQYADQENRIHGIEYYTVVAFGTPGVDGSWGLQLDGHHLAINFLVHGDSATITPAFSGADPAEVDGVNPFGDEEAAAYALVTSLTSDQLASAVLSDELFEDVFSSNAGFTDTDDGRNVDIQQFTTVGLAASELDTSQQDLLRALIATYVGDMDANLAATWQAQIDSHFNETRFAYAGEPTEGAPMYHRISSPALLVEYIHSNSMTGHPHVMVRNPNAGDYDETSDYSIFANVTGQDPMRHHILTAPHHAGDREALGLAPIERLAAAVSVAPRIPPSISLPRTGTPTDGAPHRAAARSRVAAASAAPARCGAEPAGAGEAVSVHLDVADRSLLRDDI